MRIRAQLSVASPVWMLVAAALALALFAFIDGAWVTGAVLSLIALGLTGWALRDVAAAACAWQDAVEQVGAGEH